MLALKLLKAPSFSKPVSRLCSARPSPAVFHKPRITRPSQTCRGIHQSLPLRSTSNPRKLLPISVRSHVQPRAFATKPPVRPIREQQQEGPRYRYNPGAERRGQGIGLGGGYTPIIIIAGGGATIFYFANLETVPVSGRRRFNCFSEKSAEKQGEMAYQQIMADGRAEGILLPEYDPRVVMVKRVLNRLIEGGGEDLRRVDWEVNVLQSEG